MIRFILFREETSVLFKIHLTLNNSNKVLKNLKDGYIELDQKVIYAFIIKYSDFETLYKL